MHRNLIIGLSVAVVVIVLGGIFLVSKPKQEENATTVQHTYKWQKFPDLGRTHIGEGETVKYNSNPPTSGPHLPTWERYGIKTKPVNDELLVHSLEHGYVIMSYNCAKLSKDQCSALQKQLKEVTDEKRTWKVIVIPRPNLDTTVALTAWTYLDKMDSFDKARALAFIDEFRDKGPEKTME
jgi:hypothetical protein